MEHVAAAKVAETHDSPESARLVGGMHHAVRAFVIL